MQTVAAIESVTMLSDSPIEAAAEKAHVRTGTEVAEILRQNGWLRPDQNVELDSAMIRWLAQAGDLLGPRAAIRESLAALLELIFSYDAAGILSLRESQEVMARAGAREVIREFANRVLDGGDLDSDRLKQIIDEMKLAVPYRSRAMFHPIRLALTGRAGEGELDRVILLIDTASNLNFARAVKSTRQRALEFCGALD